MTKIVCLFMGGPVSKSFIVIAICFLILVDAPSVWCYPTILSALQLMQCEHCQQMHCVI